MKVCSDQCFSNKAKRSFVQMLIQVFQVEAMGLPGRRKAEVGEMYMETVGWELTKPASYQKRKQKQNRTEHIRLGTDKKLILEATTLAPPKRRRHFRGLWPAVPSQGLGG